MWTVGKGMEWEFCPKRGPECRVLALGAKGGFARCVIPGGTHRWTLADWHDDESEPSLSDPEAPTSSEVDSGATEEPEGAQISDPVKRPAHYTHSRVEVIEAIEAWGLGYRLGNVVKYIARHEHKGRSLEDLEKAAWYLAREIAERRKTQGAT